MSIFALSNTKRGNGFASAAANQLARLTDEARRLADPTEQHVRYIRARGFTIYRSSVVDGPADHWRYCGRDIDAADVADEANRIRARTTIVGLAT